jgi:hypothetical protein
LFATVQINTLEPNPVLQPHITVFVAARCRLNLHPHNPPVHETHEISHVVFSRQTSSRPLAAGNSKVSDAVFEDLRALPTLPAPALSLYFEPVTLPWKFTGEEKGAVRDRLREFSLFSHLSSGGFVAPGEI